MRESVNSFNTGPRRARVVVLALMLAAGLSRVAGGQDSQIGHDHQPSAGQQSGERAEDEHTAPSDDPAEVGTAHKGHEGHEHEEEDDGYAEHGKVEADLRLTAAQRKRFGIVVRSAGPGSLRNEFSLPGEIVFNGDRVVHLVPRVAGVVRQVSKAMGNHVTAGEILAVIESRELADAKSEYLAAEARAELADKYYIREKALREKLVSSEQDYLEAEQTRSETRIKLRSAEQKLHALGLTRNVIKALDEEQDESITRYEIIAPMDGVVTEKHITLGESLGADTNIFTLVDLSSVWVNLTVYTKHLAAVRPGQEVMLRVDHSGAQARGQVSMVTPFVEEATRSATARVVLDNHDGRWTPGTFVTGFISSSEENLRVVVPRIAVQNIEGENVVFVEQEGVFKMRPVTVGRSDRTNVEITAGLDRKIPYAAQGAFQLKATVITRNLDSHAGHGH